MIEITNETKKIIKESLLKVEHPQYKKNLEELGFFDRLEVHPEDNTRLRLFLKSPDQDKRILIHLESQIRTALKKCSFPTKIVIKFSYDPNLVQSTEEKSNRPAQVKHLLAVASGKGGVGKSTVSANLAVSLANKGYKVGLMDADIYGPSLGKMFGVPGRLTLSGDGQKTINPYETHNIKLISFSFLLETDQAVVWRGPMLGKAIEQFLFQVAWGDLDYLILDLPPGTGDVQLSMAQLTEVDGAIIVTTPQSVALQDARRAIHMFSGVKIPVLGIVENMSEFHCPSCGHTSHIFSEGGGNELAKELKVPLLAQLPLHEDIMKASEEGTPISIHSKNKEISKAYEDFLDKLTKVIS